MDMQPNDFDRLLFFEHARKTAEDTYRTDPNDAENLTRWGGALLELSQFQGVSESKNTINDAIAKLEEALLINPTKHEALWCLGNAYTSMGFLTPESDKAKLVFNKASDFFQLALDEEPSNELYMKSLEMTDKAPELHMEIHKNGLGQHAAPSGVSSVSSNAKGSKNKKNSDLKYDIFGWIILAVGIVTWVGMAKSHLPPPPPTR